jgi:hypothetical protein
VKENVNINFSYSFERSAVNAAYRLGFWSALIVSVIGAIYFVVIVGAMLTGQFTTPPPDWLQLFGAVVSLATCSILVVLMASLHAVTPPEKRVFSQIALGFTLLFAIAVTINRFTQLGVVQQSIAAGKVDGLNWFLPYGERSVMLGLEYLGWSWCLGLAFIFAAPLFSRGTLERWLRGLLLLYSVLALISAVGFLTGSLLSLLGFVAWGVVLIFVTALLAAYFRSARP